MIRSLRMFQRQQSGAFSVEMSLLILPVIMATVFTIDIARFYMMSASLDDLALRLTQEVRNNDMAGINQGNFCATYNVTYCDFSKLGVRIEPLANVAPGASVSPGDFVYSPPANDETVLVRIKYEVAPMISYVWSPENYIISAGAFTHAL